MRSQTRALQVGILVVCLCTVAFATPAMAGDGIADFQFENRTVEAQAGDTVALELIVDSDGGYADGVAALGATIAVNSEYATITDIDHGPWLEDNENVTINRTATISEGRATVRQERLAGRDDDGVTGRARFVTVTIRIASEIPPSRLAVTLPDADAELVRGFGLRTIQHAGTIVVDGGGETIEPTAATGEDGTDGGVGVTTADDIGRNETNATSADSAEQSEPTGPQSTADDDATPGFRLLTGVLAVLALGGVLAARQQWAEKR